MSDPITITDNGAWCWFQDPRVIIDPANDTMLVTSVAAAEGPGGAPRSGNVELAIVDLNTRKTTQIVVLHERFEADDHDVPALYLRPDGRYLAMYAKHKTDNLSRWRVSTDPHDATSWRPEEAFDWSDLANRRGATYSNLHYLPAEGRLYNFVRAINDDQSIMISTDAGDTWQYGGKLMTIEKIGYVNGYTRYASNGVDRIDFITTEHHPRDFNNSIYHGYVKDAKLHRADGIVIDDNVLDPHGQPQTKLTKVFAADTVVNGERMTRAWTTDLKLDQAGRPVGVISCQANETPGDPWDRRHDKAADQLIDLRMLYVRFDGKKWHAHPLCKAGPRLLPHEQEYCGLGAIDPSDANRVYVSTPIDPRTGATTAFHEIYKGITADGGATWNWSPITSHSTAGNFRPIVLAWKGKRIVLWFRGSMTASQHYNAAIVGVFDEA